MSTTGTDGYSHDTDAIRDVADNDMMSIAQDVEQARDRFDATVPVASEAFHGGSSSAAFADLREKWAEASDGISSGMKLSRARVADAAEALRNTADEYEDVDSRAATDFEGLLQSLRER